MLKPRVKIVDVAKAAKVSPATVSNVLNESCHVDADTRARVTAVVARLGYTPDWRARRLRTGQASTIAILWSMPFAVAAGASRVSFLLGIDAGAADMDLQIIPGMRRVRSAVSARGAHASRSALTMCA